MSINISQCQIAIGHLEGGDFGPTGRQGDWKIFSGQFTTGPEPVFKAPPRVIVTPILEDEFDVGAFPVCVVRDISTTDFTLAARNSAAHGFAAFNWLAVLETPGVVNQVPTVDMGDLLPLFFNPAGALGDQGGTANPFTALSTTEAAILLTATDQNVKGHSVPAVGALQSGFLIGVGPSTTHLAARNSDLVSGSCAFHWAAFSYNRLFDTAGTSNTEPRIETGEVAAARFEPSGQPGDWRTWDIHFRDQFADSPIVLLTASKPKETPLELNPAVVGVAQAVTPLGFRLAARNSDIGKGHTGFNWVAIGLPTNRG